MLELYLLIGALLGITVIVVRRKKITEAVRALRLKTEVSIKVDSLKKQEHANIGPERFKEKHQEEAQKKQTHFAEYRQDLRQAEVAMSKQQWSEAKRLLIHALSLTPNEMEASLMLAQVYMESDDVPRAETLYKKLLEISPKNPIIHDQLGRIYAQQKRYKEAVQNYVRAVESDDKDDKRWIALGKLYHLLMRYSYAGECFRRAAELKPREVEYLFMLGEACEKDSDYENALYTYEKILTLEPYNEKAQNLAKEVRIKQNEIEKAFIKTQ